MRYNFLLMGLNRFYKSFFRVVGLGLLINTLLAFQVFGQGCDPDADKQVLLDLIEAGWQPKTGNLLNNDNLSGQQWEANDIDNYANWQGVETWSERDPNSPFGNCIYQLYLHEASSTGDIPNSIGDFGNIAYLWLSNNNLTGNVPVNVFNNLSSNGLYLFGNNFDAGPFPNDISKLTKLIVTGIDSFDENGNKFTGDFPAIPDLLDLERFFLRNHEFENLPDFPSKAKITQLGLSNNKFTFEDLIEFVDANQYPELEKFFFHPQKDFTVPQNTYNPNAGNPLTIELGIDEILESTNTPNTYNWYKSTDGGNTFAFYETTNNINSLTFDPIAVGDAGIYYCEVSNQAFDNVTGEKFLEFEGDNTLENELLKIRSENITVTVNQVANGCRTRDNEAIAKIAQVPGWDASLFIENETVFRNADGCIVKIDLSNRGITGSFPAAFSELLDLEELILKQNLITGPLPNDFINLTKLAVLHIQENNLGGNLVDHEVVFSLPAIQDLLMFSNGISGSIPPSIGNAANTLTSLSLGDNNLSGELPNEIYQLKRLRRFHLTDNALSGSISEDITGFTNLEHFWISDNNFSGPLPTALGNIAIQQDGLRFWFENNAFTFEDIIPLFSYSNLNSFTSIQYAPQAGFDTSTPFIGDEGQRLDVILDFKDGPNDTYPNLYSWYKEGSATPAYQISNNKTLTLEPLLVEDASNYTVKVTNPAFEEKMATIAAAVNDNILEITANNKVEIIVNANNPPTDITLDNNVINSDALAGSLVGNLSTTDADLPDDTHIYTLTDACNEANNNNLFAINGTELRLADNFTLPVAVNSLTVCITTTDGAQESYSELFTIRVNVNNNPPTDILLSNTIIDAVDALPSFAVGTLSTVDEDLPDDTHTYTLSNECQVASDNNLFAIDGDQLLLSPTFTLTANITSLSVCITTTDEAGDTFIKNFEITIRPTINDCVENDMAVLEAIYDALGGETWNDNTNWKTDVPLNEWFGVETNDNGCVTRILLENNNLSGNIPAEIGDFSEIIEINFGKNAISGTITTDFGKLTTLEILWLNENELTGQIPAGFFGMSSLKNLYLFQNNIQPPMPNQLNQLTALEVFGFDNNETPFIDTDFPVIGNLAALQKFFIRSHNFENVPTITNPDLLTEMGLADNRFTFEDILPFSGLDLDVFIYAPQDSVGEQSAVILQAGGAFTFDLGIDPNITNNVYKWYRDDELIEESNLNVFTIEDVKEDDAGEYICEVTNPDAPELTLYSRKTILTVTPKTELPPPVLAAELDPANPAERVLLSWTYSDEFTATSYTIEKSVGDSLNFNVITNNWTENNFTDADGLIPGETYYYRVNALVDNEVSPYSNIAFVTTNSLPTIADIDKAGLLNSTVTFQITDFTNAFEDPDSDQLAVIQILSLPEDGQLFLNNIPIAINDEIQNTEIGNLTFEPTQDFVGATNFEYNASDGFNYAEERATVNITIEDIEEVDLLVNNANTSANEVEAGSTINVSATIAVDGGPTEDESIFILLLSEDTIPDQGDIVLNSAEIPAQTSAATQQISAEIVVPDDIAPGEYYIIYFVDARQDVLETNELNNLRYIKITILPQDPEDPELTIMNMITANNDGFNDELFIKNIEDYPDNEVILLDRWGNEIFRTRGYQNDWQPVVGESILDFGAYVCIVKVGEPQVVLKRMVSITRGDGQQ